VASALAILFALVVVMGTALCVQHRTLMGQVITDPLTGAFNRRHLDASLSIAIERRNRTGEPASLLLFDVDHFKRINDALGHPAGDETLTRLVALVSRRARKLDALFRIGGEEFVLLLPGTRYAGAVVVAENLRVHVHDADLVAGRRISISIGVSELQKGQSVSCWIQNADAALYRAKRGGRNRVGSFRPNRVASLI
jgi:diguanylate cyclase (GGDEF)-like protein